MDEAIDSLARDLVSADRSVVLTGAGVSTASGIPDFRSDGGIWETHDRADFHVRRFRADPGAFWADRVALRDSLFGSGDVSPNPAHEALAALEARGHLEAVLTQNVDGLHEAAGSESVVRLHGTSQQIACTSCDARYPADPVFDRAADGDLPPRCADCDGVLKPATVLFGESMPTGPLGRARRLAETADVFLAVGSSLTVEPAASLPAMATRKGATLAVVNRDATPVADRAAVDLRTDVTEALPALVDAVEGLEN